MIDPRDVSPETFMTTAGAYGADARAVRRLYSALIGRGIHDRAVWGRSFQVPKRLGEAIGTLPRLTPDLVQTSNRDGFQKIRLRTHDGLAVETVLIPLLRPGAVSVCLSSQVAAPRLMERR